MQRPICLKTSVIRVIVLFFTASAVSLFAQVLTTLGSFNGTNGATPSASLVQGTDGNFYGTTQEGGAKSSGTVFKITPSGTLTTLYSFCSQASCHDGSSPAGALLQASDGNLYGTTAGGGIEGSGTVFKVTLNGALTTLYSFYNEPGTSFGGSPAAGLIQASDGNFYGTTAQGGVNSFGSVFKITPSGTLTTLYSFCSEDLCADGSAPLGEVLQASDGNFYGTTSNQGGAGLGTVFKLTPGGVLTTLHNFCDGPDCGYYPAAGLIQTSDGNFYGTTAGGSGTVFEISMGGTLTTLYTFCSQPSQVGCPDGESPHSGLIQAADGNLYGTTYGYFGGSPGTLFKITPGGTLTILYNFCSQPNCADGEYPLDGLIQATDGSFYGTTSYGGTSNRGTIFRIELAGLPQGVVISGILNAASYAKDANGNGSPVAPGSLIQIYATLPGATPASASALTLPN